MQSAAVKVAEDLLLEPAANVASLILSVTTALPLECNVVSAATLIISSASAKPGHPLDPHQEE